MLVIFSLFGASFFYPAYLNGSKPYISSNGIKPVFLGEDNGSSELDKFYYCAIGISFTAMWPGVITLQIPQSLALCSSLSST